MLAVVDVAEWSRPAAARREQQRCCCTARFRNGAFGCPFSDGFGLGEGDEAGNEGGEAIEGVVPGLPESRLIATRLSARGIQQLTRALRDPIL